MCASGYNRQRGLPAALAPPGTRIVCLGRGGKFMLPDPDSALHAEEGVIVMAESKQLAAFAERFGQGRREQRPNKEKQK
jgi:Trk K+ transport system NAD-binding subunit